MCGIWTLLTLNNVMDLTRLECFNAVRVRGPDSSTLHIDKNYITGFHRLAINDVSVLGNQPFYYSNNEYNYILMCNGEIYNHLELEEIIKTILKDNYTTEYLNKKTSTSDCAVLLPLFILLKEDFEKLNTLLLGEYSLVILRQSKRGDSIKYFASTDVQSVRPLFYYMRRSDTHTETETQTETQIEIGFSSLLKGLSALSGEVRRLEQKQCLIGETDLRSFNHYSLHTYYQAPSVRTIDINNHNELSALYSEIVSVLSAAVTRRLESDRPLGCLLSGGLDSSLVAALAARELAKNGKQLRTFSIGLNEQGTDIAYARMVAKHINSIHTEYYFTAEEGLNIIDDVLYASETYDITTIRASVGQYLLAKKIAANTDIKVILNGDGADEAEMGYLYFFLHPSISEAKLERDKLLEQIHYFDGLRVDRNISHHGLEARVPFLDKEFIHLYYQIQPELLVPTKEKQEKYLIRKAFETIIPNLLPTPVLWRTKEAFSDGVSSKEKSWYLIVKEHYDKLIPTTLFDEEIKKFTHLPPLCKESYYYRTKFNKLFNNNDHILPRYWLANWTESKDPSARTLNIYK